MAAAEVASKTLEPTMVMIRSTSEYDPEKDLGCTEAQNGTSYRAHSQQLRTNWGPIVSNFSCLELQINGGEMLLKKYKIFIAGNARPRVGYKRTSPGAEYPAWEQDPVPV